MTQENGTWTRLKRARYWLEEGRAEDALLLLETFHTDSEKERQERAYLLGWCYTDRRRWDEALQLLDPIPDFVEAEGNGESRYDRTKFVHCLLRLGLIAVNNARYDDAAKHYTKCIKVLRDKKLHLPIEQVKARYALAMTQSMRGFFDAAVENYKAAITFCLHIDDDEELGNIYYGLSDLYRRMENLADAKLAAVDALKFFKRCGSESCSHMMGATNNLLGHIAYLQGEYREASDHYTMAMAFAPQYSGPRMCMLNCTGLAAVRIAEHRFEEADQYCRMALEFAQQGKGKDGQLVGQTYLMFGKVAQAKAKDTDPQHKQQLLSEAIAWFEQAKEQLLQTQAYPDIAELYERWGQVLEELGQQEEALHYWKSGYAVLAAANDPR